MGESGHPGAQFTTVGKVYSCKFLNGRKNVPKASLPKKKTISLNILRSLEFARLVVV
jgi:hypothetical protein